jgi:hypothetical protein
MNCQGSLVNCAKVEYLKTFGLFTGNQSSTEVGQYNFNCIDEVFQNKT